MNDGDDLAPDKPRGHTNQNCAEFISDGDPENTTNIHSIKPDNLHGEYKGCGEREHTPHMGNYAEFIEGIDIGSTTIATGNTDMGATKPWFTASFTLRKLIKGYLKAVKEIQKHIGGTRGRSKWTRIPQASKDMAHIWDRWTDSITWDEVSQEVTDECIRTKDRWIQLGRLPQAEDCAEATRTARLHGYQLRQKNWEEVERADDGWGSPNTESQRFWLHLSDDYQLAWNGQLYGNALDEKTSIQLIDGYRRGLQDRHQTSAKRLHRNWTETREGLAAKAALSDKMARYWQGPTKGASQQERALHRRHKRAITNQVFKATLTHNTIMCRRESGAGIEQICVRLRTRTRAGGYSNEEEEYSLFAQYVARVEQLPREQKSGHALYHQLQRLEFDKMSRKRQMIELEKIGLALDSTAEAYKLYIRSDDIMYPSTHTRYELPDIRPKSLKTAELLHHRHHIKDKIKRLAKLKRESRREAFIAMKRRRKDEGECLNGAEISMGVSRTQNIFAINRSIASHWSLLSQVEDQIKVRFKLHKSNTDPIYFDEEEAGQIKEPALVVKPIRQRRQHPRPCRHHTRPHRQITSEDEEVKDAQSDSEPPTFLEELRRQRLKRWELRKSTVTYRTAHDRVGGYVSAEAEDGDNHQAPEQNRLTVCTINVAGFDEGDTKLELILQFIQDEGIDVMVCIDAQLDAKRGHWYGKIAKRRLGTGTRTNVNPCILDYGTGSTGSFKRVGGIFTILSPRWGTSLVGFQKDQFGPDGGSAGVMSQVTLATKQGQLNVIGAYWPNRHGGNDSSDQNLWKCLNRYVLLHRQQDRTPTELMQRVAMQWVATAHKNGSRGSILCGDLNATWTSGETGGQAVLQNWASQFSLHNGILKAAQRQHCSMYTRGGEGKPKTWIDHILHKGSVEHIDCLAGYTSQAAEWEGISDHRPIWGVYRVHEPRQSCPKRTRPQKVRYELRLTDRHKCDEFAEAMEALLLLPKPTDESTDEEVMDYMRMLEDHSSKTVKKLYAQSGQNKARSSWKNGWSPTYIAYKAHLTSLVEIRRSLLGQAGHKQWETVDDMLSELPELLEIWETTLDGADLTDSQKDGIHGCTGRPLQWWRAIDTLPEVGNIDEDMDKIKSMLHGTSRNEMRRRINVRIRYREDLRRAGKWRNVISSLLGNLAGRRHQPGIDLSMVETDAGDVLGDPVDIHNAVTDQFEQSWFDEKEDMFKGSMHNGADWSKCLRSEDYFMSDTEYTGAPAELRRLMFQAMTNVPQRQQIHQELEELCRLPPTVVEFETAIQHAKTNSAAGMSGCSYNQLKRWPAELIHNMHYCLSRLWTNQTTPDWWTSRWLVTIPKKQEEVPKVGNMRPLILVEAVRKLWCKLLLKRILTVWQRHNVLHRYQHGFISGRSTMTASTLFINMLEDAIERGRPLHTCTWDITRAFDSVSKNVMRIAWSRLGVPDIWLQWLVGMDEGGMTVVRTPHAVSTWNRTGRQGFRNRGKRKSQTVIDEQYRCPGTTSPTAAEPEQGETADENMADGFLATRGTGQGDVTSPTCWAALFDILLTALHMDMKMATHNRHLSSGANTGYMEGETAYADDLLSGARTQEALQRKADIVSTFCMIFGLQLSTTKLRRFVMAHSGMDDGDESVTIVHRYGGRETVDGAVWDEDRIYSSDDGVLEYLGGKYNMLGDPKATLADIKEIAVTQCAEIGNTAATGLTKIACSNMTTYAKIRYKGKLAATTLAELIGIDKIFYKFHNKSIKNMATFPYDLLYQAPCHGGVGLKRFSDLNSIDKLSEMFRTLARDDEVSLAMEGILQRTARAHGHEVGSTLRYRYAHKRGVRSWLRSATEWLQHYNIHLWRGGDRPSVGTLCSPIAMVIPDMTPIQKRRLRDKHIFHIGDIIDDRFGERCWALPENEGWMADKLPAVPTTDRAFTLWPGQYWRPHQQLEGVRLTDVVEIAHILDSTNVEVIIWRMHDRDARNTHHWRQDKNVVVPIAELFRGQLNERVDQGGKLGKRCFFKNSRLAPTPTGHSAGNQAQPDWVRKATDFCRRQGPTYRPRIYTDGAYEEKDYDLHTVFDRNAVTKKSAAGLAIVHDGPDWQDRPIFALHIGHGADIRADSAYTMEFLALAMAMRVQGPDLRATATCTDCNAVNKLVLNRRDHLGKADESHRLFLQTIDTGIREGAVAPHWVPSHAERRKKDRQRWTMDDWGNWIADKVAGSHTTQLLGELPQTEWHELSALEAVNTLPQVHELYFGDHAGRPTALYGLMEHVHRTRLERYVVQRDRQRTGLPKWEDNTMGFAAEMYNGPRKSVSRYAHTARIIWDKHWHGGNRAKQHNLSEQEREQARRCHMCGEPDSQHHCFRGCSHSNVKAVRIETTRALQEYERDHTRSLGATAEDLQTVSLMRGIMQEYNNCADAGRVWTGNWDRTMITRLQTSTDTAIISKKQCRKLRKVLHNMYAIISQGANDIMDIRHGVREILEVQRTLTLSSSPDTGQQDILDWLLDSNGLNGKQRRDRNQATIVDEEQLDNDSQISDGIAQFDWSEHTVDGVPLVWIPDISSEDNAVIDEAIATAANDQQVLATIGTYEVQVRSIRRLVNGLELDSKVIDGYMSLLQGRSTTRRVKCMGSGFFRRLFNPGGGDKHQPSDTVNMRQVSAYTRDIDIFQYQLVLVPVLVKSHWTLIAVDMASNQIRYLDSQAGNGTQFLPAIKRWLAHEWNRNPAYNATVFPTEQWRLLPSTPATSPQQQDHTSCGVFMLMFAELLADGQDVTRFDGDFCDNARRYIASCLLAGTTSPISPSNRTRSKGSPIRATRPRSQPPAGLDMGTMMDVEEEAEDCNDMQDQGTIPRSGPDDIALALESILDPHGWVTDEAISRYFRYLSERSQQWHSNMTFISPHFLNRLLDMSTNRPVFRPQFHRLFTDRTPEVELELDSLQAMHDYASIFNYTRVYLPVRRPQHWSLMEIDNSTRTITYIDSLYQGGEEYIALVESYLQQLEIVRTQEQPLAWHRRTTTFGVEENTTQIQVSRQTNGNDCGVYVCSMADLLEREQDIRQLHPSRMHQARQQLYQSMLHTTAFPLIAEDAGDERAITDNRTASDDRTTQPSAVPAVGVQGESEHMTTTAATVEPLQGLEDAMRGDGRNSPELIAQGNRSSTRPTRSTRNQEVDYTELSPKKSKKLRRLRGIRSEMCKLAIGPSQQYEGGEELFLDQEACSSGTIICYYPGKRISGAEADASTSTYIMQTQIGPDEWVYLDAADKNCGYGRYADDSLYNGTENAEWKPVGRGKARRMALVATSNIKQGMPIRAPYGWEFWYQPGVVPRELMQHAFKGYLDRIAWSSKRTKAWEFAKAVGGEAALLAKWGGRRLHEEVPVEDQVSTSMDESSDDDAQDEASWGEENTAARVQTGQKRTRGQTEETATVQPKPTPAAAVLAVESQRGAKRVSKRGRSLPMAHKARVGRPASSQSDSSDDNKPTRVHMRPIALPVYRAGTNYIARRQHIIEKRMETHATTTNTSATTGRKRPAKVQRHREDHTTQNCAEQRHLEDSSALQQETTDDRQVRTRHAGVDTHTKGGKLATGRRSADMEHTLVINTDTQVACGDEDGTQDQVRGSGQHRDYAKERMKTRLSKQLSLRPTETRTRGTTATSLLSTDDVAISGVETPLEERSQDGTTSSRRVDDVVDNGRSSTPVIGEWEAGTDQRIAQDTTEQTYKRRRLRDRDVTAPDAEEADEEGPAARIDSSRCIHDDVKSDGNTSHVALTRTHGRRTLGQGDAPGSR